MKIYDFTVKNRKGEDVSLENFKGKVLLIVNTATRCGFTPQYDELEALYIISSILPLYLFITKQEYILTSITIKSVNTIINFVFFLIIYKNAFFSIMFLLLEYIILYFYEIYMK